MFLHGRFSLLRFSLRAENGDDVIYAAAMAATLRAMIATGGNLSGAVFMAAMAEGVHRGAAGVPLAGALSSRFFGSAQGALSTPGPFRMEERIFCASVLAQNACPFISPGAALGGLFAVSANDAFTAEVACALYGRRSLALNRPIFDLCMYAFFSAQVTTFHFTIRYQELSLVIPPGATLVIDSENYTVLLDGENVLEAHSGAWPTLSRDLYDIVVEPVGVPEGSERLEKKILYTEKYL